VSSHSKESRDDIGGNKAGVNVRRRLFLTSLGVAAISVGVGYVLGSVSKPLEVGREILTTTVTKTATQTIEHTRPLKWLQKLSLLLFPLLLLRQLSVVQLLQALALS